jgi:hypothetical protein
MISEKDIIIRRAIENDGIEACKLLKKLGLHLPETDEDILRHWKRLWKLNPYYNQFNETIQYGWVMEHNKKIVGFFGSIPRVYYFNSKPIPVSIASQWGVEKDYRDFTSLLCDQYFKNNNCSLKIVTTAIKPTGNIFVRYGGKKVPNENLGLVYMIPISLFKVVAVKFKNPLIKSFFLLLNNWFPWGFQYKLIRRNKNITKIQIDSHSKELDLFLKNFHANTSGLVAARTSEIIKWFNSSAHSKPHKEYFIYSENNQIKGFAAISNENIPGTPDLLRFKIIDLLAESKPIKKAILKELVRYSYRKNADIVEIHHPGFVDKKEIPISIVLKRKHAHFPLYYQTTDKSFDGILQNTVNWNISSFDGDTSL